MQQVKLDLIDPNPAQPRKDMGDLDGLARSIGELGVLQPIVLMADGERYVTVAGHRRVAAAKMCDLTDIAAVVVADFDEAARLGALVAENTVRKDLTDSEAATGVQTLMALGVAPETAADMTGHDREVVRRARDAAETLGDKAFDLSLDDLSAIEEFADDPKLQKQLIKSAGTDDFRYRLSCARGDRVRAERLREATERFEAAGYAVLTGHPSPPAARIDGLLHDGEPLSVEAHASCPGRAVFLAPYGETHYCTDPEAHGHTNRWNRSETEDERALREERLAVQRKREADFDDASEARRAWIREELLVAKTMHKAVMPWVSALARKEGIDSAGCWGSKDVYASVSGQLKANAHEKHLVALAIATAESSYARQRSGVGCYDSGLGTVAAYLDFLEAAGYALAPIDKAIRAELSAETTKTCDDCLNEDCEGSPDGVCDDFEEETC